MKTDLTLTHACFQRFNPLMWIRIGFNADPHPGCQTNAETCGSLSLYWSDFKKLQKVEFLHEYEIIGKTKTYLQRYGKPFERQETRFVC
jgi:hypothetical protein